MKELLIKGKNGALVKIETERKYEIVSCYGYNEKDGTWAQGHYFTVWDNDPIEKVNALINATKHFAEHYA